MSNLFSKNYFRETLRTYGPEAEAGFSGCPRFSRIWSRIYKICKIQQEFVSRSEQDQAILLYRGGRCMAAPVVRDRLIANGSGSGDPDSMLSVIPTVARDRPSPYGKA